MYFKKYDFLIYIFIIGLLLYLGHIFMKLKETNGSRAEIYVNNRLEYTYKLQKNEKDIFVKTDIGGVKIRLKNYKIRVLTSNSPKKLCIKQGWINRAGEMIIGVPDRLLIKIISKKEDVDFILH